MIIGRIKSKIKKIYQKIFFIKPDPSEYTACLGIGSVVPCQIEAYFLGLNKYLGSDETVLDVGFGLGYGLNILAIKASSVSGVDVDKKAFEYCNNTVVGRNPKLDKISLYDGCHLPYKDNSFDIVTCIDVLEHVPDFDTFVDELIRVSKKGVLISTPNRRPEYTNKDGTPKNYWHLREWSFEELNSILVNHSESIDWNFLNGPFEGPFTISDKVLENTLTLTPYISK